MSSSRAFASLSSALLARKGGARPAMRSPLQDNGLQDNDPATRHDPLSDLGWNDLGPAAEAVASEPVLGVVVFESAVAPVTAPVGTPVATPVAATAPLLASKPAPAEVVPLLREVPAGALPRAASLSPMVARSIPRRTRTAAFTLRLDPERHYRLRVACAVQGRSAQSLVTEAVDRFLDQQPDTQLFVASAGAQRIA